jgi:hypothetical protein
MRPVRSASAVLTLAGVAAFAGTAMPAFAAGPQIDVYPSVAVPGQWVSFSAVCIHGKSTGTSATLFGTTLGLPARMPMDKSTHKGVFQLSVKVPWGTKAGAYSLSVDCDNDLSGTGTLWVRSGWVKPAVIRPAVIVPNGAPVTGDGITSTAVGGPLTAVGLGVLGVSSLLGVFALRRRKAAASK